MGSKTFTAEQIILKLCEVEAQVGQGSSIADACGSVQSLQQKVRPWHKVRENGVIRSRAVLIAIDIDWEGRRQILGVELAKRETANSWKEYLLFLKERGLKGIELVGQGSKATPPRGG